MALQAVDVNTNAIENKRVFGIEFSGQNRAYYAREAGIQSISKQEYITSNFRVLELNVVTVGPALLRIYYSRPLEPDELSASLGNAMQASGIPGASAIKAPTPSQLEKVNSKAYDAIDQLTGSTVFKEYPYATHSHTVEFRVSRRSELIELHDELKKHWLKEPAFFEDGQIVSESSDTSSEMKPRTLGGTLFKVK